MLDPGQVGIVHGKNEEKFQVIVSVYMSWEMWVYYVHRRCLTCSQPTCSGMLAQVVFAPDGKFMVCPSRWLEARLLCHCHLPSVP